MLAQHSFTNNSPTIVASLTNQPLLIATDGSEKSGRAATDGSLLTRRDLSLPQDKELLMDIAFLPFAAKHTASLQPPDSYYDYDSSTTSLLTTTLSHGGAIAKASSNG